MICNVDLFGVVEQEEPGEILARAIDTYNPSKVYALFSGGHDSLCVAHLASKASRFDGCVHVNTGIGIPETRQFVRDTCQTFGWPLREMHPPKFTGIVKCRKCNGKGCGACVGGKRDIRKPGIDYEGSTAYEAIVLHYGFPGPSGHTMIYNRLKERCVATLIRESGGGNCRECGLARKGHGSPKSRKMRNDHSFVRSKILLVTGVRKQESRRRMGHIVAIQEEGSRVWVAPAVDWAARDKEAYLEEHNLPRNPVVGKLCMSGECLCGAFASPGELYEIANYYPEVVDYIKGLMAKADEIGSPRIKWGEKPEKSKERKTPQTSSLFGKCMGLCWSCESNAEEQGVIPAESERNLFA